MIRLDSHQLPKLVLLALLAIGLPATSVIPSTQELAVYPFSPRELLARVRAALRHAAEPNV